MTIPQQTPSTAQSDVLAVLRAALMQTPPAEPAKARAPVEPLPHGEMTDALTTLQNKLATLFGAVVLMDPGVSSSVSHLQQLAAGIERDLDACLENLSSITEAFNMILSMLHASDGSDVSPQALIRLIEPLHQQLENINTSLVLML